MQISFELSDRDLEHFVAMARTAQDAARSKEDFAQITAAAAALFNKVKSVDLPDFIVDRLKQLKNLVKMVDDDDWQLPEKDLERVVSAMAYFANPEDLIEDRVPGIGFLDDAIMVDLVTRNLEHEIAAYAEFCRYRETEKRRRENEGLPTNVGREDWLADKRATLQSQMHDRRETRDASPSWKLRLW